jgi:adenosylhomocysteine nucleosidase
LKMKAVLLPLLAAACWGAKFDLLVEGAADSELKPLVAALQGKKEVTVGAWTFWTGKIGKKTVVVSRSGMGPINAVAATTIAIEHFHPAAIIDQGTAGAQNPEFQIWDIVLGAKTTDYGAFQSDHADAGAGTDSARWKPMAHEIQGKPYPVFAGDAKLIALAKAVPYARARVVEGTIGSAYEFNREIDRIAWLRKTYGTDSEDMESVYIAGVAAGMGVPFLAIRIISDSEYTHPKYEEIAGQYCAEFVRDFIRAMK